MAELSDPRWLCGLACIVMVLTQNLSELNVRLRESNQTSFFPFKIENYLKAAVANATGKPGAFSYFSGTKTCIKKRTREEACKFSLDILQVISSPKSEGTGSAMANVDIKDASTNR